MTNQKKLSTWQTIGLVALLLSLVTAPLVAVYWFLGIDLSLLSRSLIRIWKHLDWEIVFDETWSKLAAWFLVFAAYHVAYVAAGAMRKEKFWNSKAGMFLAYPCFLFWVAVVSLCLWAGYGTSVVDDDPRRGGGEVIQDFEPTKKERNEYGVATFFVLAAPSLVAVYRHYKKNPVEGVPK